MYGIYVYTNVHTRPTLDDDTGIHLYSVIYFRLRSLPKYEYVHLGRKRSISLIILSLSETNNVRNLGFPRSLYVRQPSVFLSLTFELMDHMTARQFHPIDGKLDNLTRIVIVL
jgi:hypothetical protein